MGFLSIAFDSQLFISFLLRPWHCAEGLDRRPGQFWRFYLNSSWHQLLMGQLAQYVSLQECTDGELQWVKEKKKEYALGVDGGGQLRRWVY